MSEPSSQRQTLSFYSYRHLDEHHNGEEDGLAAIREQLKAQLEALDVYGRIYIAAEGINGQVSIYPASLHPLKKLLHEQFGVSSLRWAIEEGESFTKLTLKLKSTLVADGGRPPLPEYGVGAHVDALRWHELMDEVDSITVDVRNNYEHEVGHFKGAHLMQVETFRDQLQRLPQELASFKQHKILLYCTGGIRCEKASSLLLEQGFKAVFQLSGGIIQYKQQLDALGLQSRFLGKNFVFDQRLSERITPDILAKCYTCGTPTDELKNCTWMGCNTLFVQCDTCGTKLDHCCSESCQHKNSLSPEEQQAIVQNFSRPVPRFKSRSQTEWTAPHHQKATINGVAQPSDKG